MLRRIYKLVHAFRFKTCRSTFCFPQDLRKCLSISVKMQSLAIRMRGAALLQLQSLATGMQENYTTLKMALRGKFVPKEWVELHKAEFRARHRERDEKLPDLASSLRRFVSRAYLEAVPDLQDSLAKDQFIDALEDREMRMKLRESGPKTLHEAVSRALQIEAMYEAESRCKGRSVRVVQQSSKSENSELLELIKQNTAAMNQMVNFVQQQQQQQPSSEPKRNGQGLGLNAERARDLRFRLCFKCHKRGILWQIVNKRLRSRETSRDRASVGKVRTTPKIKDVKTVVGNHSVCCDTAV